MTYITLRRLQNDEFKEMFKGVDFELVQTLRCIRTSTISAARIFFQQMANKAEDRKKPAKKTNCY